MTPEDDQATIYSMWVETENIPLKPDYYGPRTIRATRDSNRFIVGCKDGSIQILDIEQNAQRHGSSGAGQTGTHEPLVRTTTMMIGDKKRLENRIWSFLEWSEGRLLVGTRTGALALFSLSDLKPGEENRFDDLAHKELVEGDTLRSMISPELDSVRYLGRLTEHEVIVSFKRGGSLLLYLREGQNLKQTLESAVHLDGMSNLGCAVRVKRSVVDTQERERSLRAEITLFLARDGNAWIAPAGKAWVGDPQKGEGEASETIKDRIKAVKIWTKDEKPAYIEDFTLIKPPWIEGDHEKRNRVKQEACEGVYVSTDLGVFKVNPIPLVTEDSDDVVWDTDKGGFESPRTHGEPVALEVRHSLQIFLPFLAGQPMGISQFTQRVEGRNRHFLWVSDASGNLHIYYCDNQIRLGYHWKQIRVLHGKAQVLHCYTSWYMTDNRFLVIQSRRDDSIEVSFFYLSDASTPREHFSEDSEEMDEAIVFSFLNAEKDSFPAITDLLKRKGWLTEEIAAKGSSLHVAAAFFEYAAHTKTRQGAYYLELFLRTPNEDIGVRGFHALEDKHPAAMVEALDYWVYVLMGAIHGLGSERTRDEYFQRLMRWLRLLEQRLTDPEHEHGLTDAAVTALHAEIEQIIPFVRKWGFFRNSLADRLQLRLLVDLLREEREDGVKRIPDQLVSTSLLFERGADPHKPIESTDPQNPIRNLLLHRDKIVMIYANREAETFLAKEEGPPFARRPLYRTTGRSGEKPKLRLERGAIWSFGDDVFLVGSKPIVDTGTPRDQEAVILRLDDPDGIRDLDIAKLWSDDIAAQTSSARQGLVIKQPRIEYLYGFTRLGRQFLLIGLNGVGGKACVALGEIVGNTLTNLSICSIAALTSGGLSETALNPVKAMVCDEDRIPSIYVGCEDGQIACITPTIVEDELRLPPEARQIAQLGNPISAIATSRVGARLRLFVGTIDGTIVAYQKMEPDDEISGEKRESYPILWATVEFGMIESIYAFTIDEEKQGDKEPQEVVLATTTEGESAFFDNRGDIPAAGEEPGRLKMAGCRMGRFLRDEKIISSGLLVRDSERPQLITSNEEGQVRCVTLQYLEGTRARKEEFDKVKKKMFKLLEKKETRTFFARGGHAALRLPEAFRGTTSLPLFALVRMFFERDRETERLLHDLLADGGDMWLPVYLRDFWVFRCQWLKEDRAEQNTESLDRCLEAIVHARDVMLYEEIVRLITRETNLTIFELVDEDQEQVEGTLIFYGKILNALDRGNELWKRVSIHDHKQVISTTVKKMMDGDALWAIACLPARASEALLTLRIKAFRKFLMQGDTVVALEALRACNYSLIRCSLRMGRARGEDWYPGANLYAAEATDLDWKIIQPFFQAIGDFTARVVATDVTANVALRHEISRAFAFGIFVCPSATIPLAHCLTETRSPKAIYDQIEEQIRLMDPDLEVDGISLALFKSAVENFRPWLPFLTRLLDGEEDRSPYHPFDMVRCTQLLGKAGRDKEIGRENLEILQSYLPYCAIICYLESLTKLFGDNARDIDLTRTRALFESIDREVRGDFAFRHTHEFWREAMGMLAEKLRHVSPSGKDIRPEVVLASLDIADWAHLQQENLERLWVQHRIFEPEYSSWKTLLKNLEQTARAFPKSTAVHQNIVLAVLGHGLLENLDEHMFEMEEIAQALDPVGVWLFSKNDGIVDQFETEDDPTLDVSQRVARYLMFRSRHAESVPKNLRSLQGLFDPEGSTGEKHAKSLFRNFACLARRKGKTPRPADQYSWLCKHHDLEGIPVDPNDFQSLVVALNELDRNDRIHYQRSKVEDRAELIIEPKRNRLVGERDRNELSAFEILFPLNPDKRSEDDIQRLEDVFGPSGKHLQNPVPPIEGRDIPSHGLGLYLASLAAASVQWRMVPKLEPERTDDAEPVYTHVRFSFRKVRS